MNPQDVLIGADATASTVNLNAALTTDLGLRTNEGILYGKATVANSDITYPLTGTTLRTGLSAPFAGAANIGGTTYPYVFLGATDFGAAYNLILLAESTSNARSTWLSDLLSLSHTTTTYTGGSNPSFDSTITGASTWLEFNDPDTNVVKSPIIDDQWDRYYFASPSTIPEYNTHDRITAGLPAWLLGVPPPGCAPTLSVTGGGNTMVLGNQSSDGADFSGFANYIYLTKVVPPGDTLIQDVQWFASTNDPGEPTARFAALVYTDNNGVPGDLLNTGEIITGVVSGAANESSFLNPTSLLNNEAYWIGFMIDTAVVLDGGPVGGANNTASFANTFSNGPPGTAPAAAVNQPGLHMFGDFLTSDIVESRAYSYTWVSEYGEEGPPAPPSSLDGWSNGTWDAGSRTAVSRSGPGDRRTVSTAAGSRRPRQ